MTSRKVVGYAVVPINWEYNDEYNYSSGLGGPEAVYRHRAEATKHAQELSRLDLAGAGDDLGLYLGEDGLTKAQCLELEAITGSQHAWDSDIVLPDGLSDDQLDKILELTGLRFYVVLETGLNV